MDNNDIVGGGKTIPSGMKLRSDKMERLLRESGQLLKSKMPAGVLFTLLLTDDSGLFYISSAEREGMIEAMKEFIRNQEGVVEAKPEGEVKQLRDQLAEALEALSILFASCSTTHPDWGADICEPDGNAMSNACGVLAKYPEAKRAK